MRISYTIKLNKSFYIPIMTNASCNDKCCVYIIHCKLCLTYYIGQTGRTAHERLREHLYCIKLNKTHSEVAVHFNAPNHKIKEHFEFYIFKSNINNKIERYYIENDLINIFKYISGSVINGFIPRTYLIKKTLTFQH